MLYSKRSYLHHLFVGITDFVFTIILLLLGLRFIFRLFNANVMAPFTGWLYALTGDLIYPFRGIFPSPIITGGIVFDMTALVAIVIYALIFSIIIYLFDILYRID